MIPVWLRVAGEVGHELWVEWRNKRRRDKAAAKWAKAPSVVTACFRCKEIAYLPGQVSCTKCGWPLKRAV